MAATKAAPMMAMILNRSGNGSAFERTNVARSIPPKDRTNIAVEADVVPSSARARKAAAFHTARNIHGDSHIQPKRPRFLKLPAGL
jgi:hypothetical protein